MCLPTWTTPPVDWYETSAWIASADCAAEEPDPVPTDVQLVITYPDGGRTVLDSQDLLWSGRMIMGEGGANSPEEAAAILWTLVQRKWWGTGMPTPNPHAFAGYRSWTTYIQSFSQPINPIWLDPTSHVCQVNPSACTPGVIAHRQRMSALGWDDLTPTVQNALAAFAAGTLVNPVPGVVDFRANDGTARAIIAADPLRDAQAGLQNVYLYARGGKSRDWGGAGISFDSGLDPTAAVVASLIPGGRRFLAGVLGT